MHEEHQRTHYLSLKLISNLFILTKIQRQAKSQLATSVTRTYRHKKVNEMQETGPDWTDQQTATATHRLRARKAKEVDKSDMYAIHFSSVRQCETASLRASMEAEPCSNLSRHLSFALSSATNATLPPIRTQCAVNQAHLDSLSRHRLPCRHRPLTWCWASGRTIAGAVAQVAGGIRRTLCTRTVCVRASAVLAFTEGTSTLLRGIGGRAHTRGACTLRAVVNCRRRSATLLLAVLT